MSAEKPTRRKLTPHPERPGNPRPDLLLGSGLGFVDAFLDALGTTMTAAIKFLGAFNLFMGHEIAP